MAGIGGLAHAWLAAAALAAGCAQVSPAPLDVYPNHTRLLVGERIRYSVFHQRDGAPRQVEDYRLVPADASVVRVVDRWWIEAMAPGRTDLYVSSAVGRRTLGIEVSPEASFPMAATHHSEVARIAGEELLFVGHANLDGFDHTAVAKPGIDRLVQEFKQRGQTVAYWISEEYPYWYTDDRRPDLAIVSEGQEHQVLADAERIVFSGGDFMFCVARNVQMTLHGMLRAGSRRRIHLVFPAAAIWAADTFTPGRHKPYPAPMALLGRLMSERSSWQERYEGLVLPFLERVFGEFPVGGYPASAPTPPLEEIMDGWRIDVAFDDDFAETFREGASDRVILLDFRLRPAS